VAGDVAGAVPMNPDGSYTVDLRECWNRLGRRLRWFHGLTRTASILVGNDPETNADLAKWRNLGQGKTS
jgi:hypothetical protein